MVLSLLTPPTYRAQAEILLYKSKVEITLDPKFQTLSEEELIRFTNQDPRRLTFSTLAVSDQVLNQTIEMLPDEWRSDWSLNKLANNAEVDNAGSLLMLSVKAKNPEEAALVTNVWINTFVDYANRNLREPIEMIEAIDEQVVANYLEYKIAQNDLTVFLGDNQIDELEFQISVKERTINNLLSAYMSTIQNELATQLSVNQQIPMLIEEAKVLRGSIADKRPEAPVDISIRIALILLEANVYNAGVFVSGGSQRSQPTELQLSIPVTSDTQLLAADALILLENLIVSFETLNERLGDIVYTRSLELLTRSNLDQELIEAINFLFAEIDDLKAELETEKARNKELASLRDLAWEDYLILSRKASELAIANQTAETEILVAAEAVTPENPIGPSVVLNTGIGIALGLTLSLVIAFLRAFIGDED